jgi:hypothetical protein
MSNIRTIVRNARFEQEIASLESNVKRADEFLEGVEEILSREPQSGHRLGNSHVYFISGWTIDLNVYYTFTDNEVILLSICQMTPPEP